MIDNINIITPLLKFDSEDDFYFLQILQRKKDNPMLRSNSRVIKNYYIKSVDYLLDRYEEIKTLCNVFNARASLRLNKRSFERIGFKCLENLANTMQNREYNHLMKSYDRACGLLNNEKEKKWVVDVDKEEVIWLEQIIEAIQGCKPDKDKVIAHIPSKSGVHLITSPFNTAEFKNNLAQKLITTNIDIHKDNPVNLYIP